MTPTSFTLTVLGVFMFESLNSILGRASTKSIKCPPSGHAVYYTWRRKR